MTATAFYQVLALRSSLWLSSRTHCRFIVDKTYIKDPHYLPGAAPVYHTAGTLDRFPLEPFIYVDTLDLVGLA